jgi:hypothetical protein|tara:strand:+ start:553 stop:963 length:411 start_codon:yes stop_codon:yes gene_type:complete
MQSVLSFNRRKKSYSTKGLCALFRIRERSKRKAHVKIKPKERLNVMAAIKGKSKLKSLLSKIFRNLDNEDTADLVNNVVILQHLKGKSVEQVIAELRKEKVDAEKNKDKNYYRKQKNWGKKGSEKKKLGEKTPEFY